MDKISLLLFALIRCAVHAEEPAEDTLANLKNLNEAEWQELLSMASKKRMTAVLYPVLEKYGVFSDEHSDVQEKWKRAAKAAVLRQMEITRAVYKINAEGVKRGIALVFMKGPVIADLYPHYSQRRSFDIDILVADGEKDAAVQMIEDMGYEQNQANSKNHVQVFSSVDPGSVIELHTRLWEDYEGQKITMLESLSLDKNSVSVKACTLDIMTLEPTYHLIYQIFHIVKHFMLDSIGARYLVDITLFIERYREQINFKIFRESMEALGYMQFCKQFFSLCGVYLGLDTGFFIEGEPILDIDAQNLMADIMGGGVIVADNQDRWQLQGIMTPYFVGKKRISKTSFRRKMDAIFLRREDIQIQLSYVKKSKLLLPVAWLHRAFLYALRRCVLERKRIYSVPEKLKLTEQRLYLLNRLGLIDEKE